MSDARALALLDATAQAELVRKAELTPRELVAAAIERIESTNASLNAVIHTHFERALREADALPNGPLRGVPFLLKDLAGGNRKGDPIHWGTRFLRDARYTANTTSYLVEAFERCGLSFVGRTNVPSSGPGRPPSPKPTAPPATPGTPRTPAADRAAARRRRWPRAWSPSPTPATAAARSATRPANRA